jgi:hypothetical protein
VRSVGEVHGHGCSGGVHPHPHPPTPKEINQGRQAVELVLSLSSPSSPSSATTTSSARRKEEQGVKQGEEVEVSDVTRSVAAPSCARQRLPDLYLYLALDVVPQVLSHHTTSHHISSHHLAAATREARARSPPRPRVAASTSSFGYGYGYRARWGCVAR